MSKYAEPRGHVAVRAMKIRKAECAAVRPVPDGSASMKDGRLSWPVEVANSDKLKRAHKDVNCVRHVAEKQIKSRRRLLLRGFLGSRAFDAISVSRFLVIMGSKFIS